MKKILSFDISSSTIGWSLFQYDDQEFKLIDYGFIKPPKSSKKKKKSLSFRLNKTVDMIEDLITKTNPDDIAVEDYAKKFTKGRSTANTIIVLSTFNEVVCMTSFRMLKKDVHRYAVTTIRAQVSKLFNSKIVSKDDIFPEIKSRSTFFKPQLNRNNNIKTESMDVADAIAVGITHILKENPNVKRYYL